MRVSVNITFKLWDDLGLQFISPNDPEAQLCFLDLGLRWVQMNDNPLHQYYDVIDKEKFLLSVIEYGIVFEEI